jgi:dipeptidase D
LSRAESLAKLLDIKYSFMQGATAWQQDKNSKFIRTIIDELNKDRTLKEKARATITPGGCEAAFFLTGKKTSFINGILWGPDIFELHSPNEHLSIKSVDFVFKTLCRLLQKIN